MVPRVGLELTNKSVSEFSDNYFAGGKFEIQISLAMRHSRGIIALFSGVTGTGKTMAAEMLTNHFKLNLFLIFLLAVVSKYIGETEKNLQKPFDTTEQKGHIMFIYEADSLFLNGLRRKIVKTAMPTSKSTTCCSL